MTVHSIEKEKVKRIPREVVEKRDDYIRQHKIALLQLLIEENPERAKLIMDRLQQKQAA
jgi:hypothetical protein